MTDNLNFKNLGILFTFYSIVYVFVYYGFYGVNIFYYTDLQGVLTLFLSNMIKILIFVTIVLIAWMGISEKNIVVSQAFNKVSLRRTLYILILLLVIFVGAWALLLSGIRTPLQKKAIFIAFIAVGILSAIDRLSKLIFFKFKISANKLKMYFFVLLIVPYFMCQLILLEVNYFPKTDHLFFCYNEYKTVETGEKFNQYLIGKTNDNIFIYDKSKNQTLIYEMSNVKDFIIFDAPAPYLLPSIGAPMPDKAP
ncbi:hypothetical protein [Flavobacterium humidisoli]|uniref:Uncharacterized protein n=1 Tax=Flavobacterium humidisoli TaxID=2937442 RepID=A0ABY4LQL9_9FLAO|nr:hypothetical protein [Flavobacterium humidisoli]UPZ13945.1 hypothetical protein M0M44_14415 [Flavobacterium humidisoli]